MYKVIMPTELAEIIAGLVSNPSLFNTLASGEAHKRFLVALRGLVIAHFPDLNTHASLCEAVCGLLCDASEVDDPSDVLARYALFVSIGQLVSTFCGGAVFGVGLDHGIKQIQSIKALEQGLVVRPGEDFNAEDFNVWSFHDIKADSTEFGKLPGREECAAVRSQLRSLIVQTYAVVGRLHGDDNDQLKLVDAAGWEEANDRFSASVRSESSVTPDHEVYVSSCDKVSKLMASRIAATEGTSLLDGMLGSELCTGVTTEQKNGLILAALRHFQEAIRKGDSLDSVSTIVDAEMVNEAVIDALCEEINYGREEEHFSVVGLSTGHLTMNDRDVLDAQQFSDLQNVMVRDSGYFFRLHTQSPESNSLPGQSESLKAIVDWALSSGYEMIMFDGDAGVLDRFPVFEWEEAANV